ncbi:ThiF family adenylyltransferase, partial [Streptomyces hainanensis]
MIHSQADIGKSKALSAKETVQGINPYVQVNIHEERLDSSNV